MGYIEKLEKEEKAEIRAIREYFHEQRVKVVLSFIEKVRVAIKEEGNGRKVLDEAKALLDTLETRCAENVAACRKRYEVKLQEYVQSFAQKV